MRLALLLSLAPVSALAAPPGLPLLHPQQNVRVSLVTTGPLCSARVHQLSPISVTIRLAKTTAGCGAAGRLVEIPHRRIVQVTPEFRLTPRRFLARSAAALAGVGALFLVPLNDSDPESWLLVANGVVPGFVAVHLWQAIPKRRDSLILISCPGGDHCFPDSLTPPTAR